VPRVGRRLKEGLEMMEFRSMAMLTGRRAPYSAPGTTIGTGT
jgi:hypothetical protein